MPENAEAHESPLGIGGPRSRALTHALRGELDPGAPAVWAGDADPGLEGGGREGFAAEGAGCGVGPGAARAAGRVGPVVETGGVEGVGAAGCCCGRDGSPCGFLVSVSVSVGVSAGRGIVLVRPHRGDR